MSKKAYVRYWARGLDDLRYSSEGIFCSEADQYLTCGRSGCAGPKTRGLVPLKVSILVVENGSNTGDHV